MGDKMNTKWVITLVALSEIVVSIAIIVLGFIDSMIK
jgi:hypothetical protein